MFIFAIIVILIGISAFIVGHRAHKKGDQRVTVEAPDRYSRASVTGTDHSRYSFIRWIGLGVIGIGVILGLSTTVYTQDTGDANVLRDWTGNVVGQETSSGLHFKAPWVDTITFNIRQQPVVFGTNTDNGSSHTGGTVLGTKVQTNDKSGVQVYVSVALRYSIDPTKVDAIYNQFKSEENFKQAFITQDVRSAVRSAPNDFTTIQVLTDRSKLQPAMQQEIEDHWKGSGVTIDSISIQEVEYPKTVTDSYSEAVKSQIKVTQAQNNLDAATIDAKQTVVKAQAQADANNLLNGSLTGNILTQQYIDAIAKSGSVYVVPQGSTPYIGAK